MHRDTSTHRPSFTHTLQQATPTLPPSAADTNQHPFHLARSQRPGCPLLDSRLVFLNRFPVQFRLPRCVRSPPTTLTQHPRTPCSHNQPLDLLRQPYVRPSPRTSNTRNLPTRHPHHWLHFTSHHLCIWHMQPLTPPPSCSGTALSTARAPPTSQVHPLHPHPVLRPRFMCPCVCVRDT